MLIIIAWNNLMEELLDNVFARKDITITMIKKNIFVVRIFG